MARYNVDPVEIEINHLFDRLVFRVNQRRLAVLAEYRNRCDDITSRPRALARKEGELNEMRNQTELCLQMNQLHNFREDFLDEIELALVEVRRAQPDTRAVFRSQPIPLEKLISELGEVFEEEILTVPRYQTMSSVIVIQNGRAPGQLYGTNGVAIDSDNRIFVAEGLLLKSVPRISIFSSRGQFLDCFTPKDMRFPYGLAIHNDNLYITDTVLNAIFHYKTATNFPFVSKRGTEKGNSEKFGYPENLTVSTNGEIYVAECENNRVQILDSSLNHLRYLTKDPIIRPRDVKLTAKEVYVLVYDIPCIVVFSYAGEKLRSLIPINNLCLFFCLDSADNIIISEHDGHHIQVFTKSGDLIRTIGEKGQQPQQFHHPRGLALTNELNLVVVSDNTDFALQIFVSP
eukprot:TRINITY_DN2057_c1_g1_i2.p1 TRINITY_DN2057_c1_g1~~TRINITY_DN2057_c1_g1_i2.p1  ORF type:complete len:402 (+),score=49.70 TRINITY_DN2057_c1_g1_i2:124-1329(+)